jgi:hypothetical protein
MSVTESVNASLRLCLLRLLSEPELNYQANVPVLQTSAKVLGFDVSRTRIDAQVDWLNDAGLVTVEDLSGRVRVVTITERGIDVASGRAVVAGVDRPTPKAR